MVLENNKMLLKLTFEGQASLSIGVKAIVLVNSGSVSGNSISKGKSKGCDLILGSGFLNVENWSGGIGSHKHFSGSFLRELVHDCS